MAQHLLMIRVQDVGQVRGVLPSIPLNEWCESMVAIDHVGKGGTNPHFHIVGRFIGAKVESVRQRLRRVLAAGQETTARGNGFCSIKPWDGSIDAISYLFHEDDDAPLLIQFNVPDSLIVQARARNIEIKAQVVEHKKAGRIDNARLFSMCEAACQEIQKTLGTAPSAFPKWRVFKVYYELCVQEKKNFPPRFAIPGIIKRVQGALCGDCPTQLRLLFFNIFSEEFPTDTAPYEFAGALDV